MKLFGINITGGFGLQLNKGVFKQDYDRLLGTYNYQSLVNEPDFNKLLNNNFSITPRDVMVDVYKFIIGENIFYLVSGDSNYFILFLVGVSAPSNFEITNNRLNLINPDIKEVEKVDNIRISSDSKSYGVEKVLLNEMIETCRKITVSSNQLTSPLEKVSSSFYYPPSVEAVFASSVQDKYVVCKRNIAVPSQEELGSTIQVMINFKNRILQRQ